MHIPEKIIEALEFMPLEDRGQALAVVIAFMRDGTDMEERLSGMARGAFIMAKAILDPIMKRRRRDAARRAAKRRAKESGLICEKQQKQAAPEADAACVSGMSRAERRRLQNRLMRDRHRLGSGMIGDYSIFTNL